MRSQCVHSSGNRKQRGQKRHPANRKTSEQHNHNHKKRNEKTPAKKNRTKRGFSSSVPRRGASPHPSVCTVRVALFRCVVATLACLSSISTFCGPFRCCLPGAQTVQAPNTLAHDSPPRDLFIPVVAHAITFKSPHFCCHTSIHPSTHPPTHPPAFEQTSNPPTYASQSTHPSIRRRLPPPTYQDVTTKRHQRCRSRQNVIINGEDHDKASPKVRKRQAQTQCKRKTDAKQNQQPTTKIILSSSSSSSSPSSSPSSPPSVVRRRCRRRRRRRRRRRVVVVVVKLTVNTPSTSVLLHSPSDSTPLGVTAELSD